MQKKEVSPFLTALELRDHPVVPQMPENSIQVPGILEPINRNQLQPNAVQRLPEHARAQVMQQLAIIKKEDQQNRVVQQTRVPPRVFSPSKSEMYGSLSKIHQHEVIMLDALLSYLRPLIPRDLSGKIQEDVPETAKKRLLFVSNGTKYKSGPLHQSMIYDSLDRLSAREYHLRDLPMMYAQIPAVDLYRGYHHRLMTNFSKRVSKYLQVEHRIISPAWGLVKPSDTLPNYDCTFAGKSRDEITTMTSMTGVLTDIHRLIHNPDSRFDLVIFGLTPSFGIIRDSLFLNYQHIKVIDVMYNHHDLNISVRENR